MTNSVLRHLLVAVHPPESGNVTDGQLLESFLTRREEAAFEALMRRHGPMVLGVCRRVLRNAHDAEDAYQATFLVLVRKASSIRPRELVGNWLYGVAYRTALRSRAMNARRRVKENQTPQPETPAEPELNDLFPLLDQELSRLPEKYRVAVVLCDLEGKSRREVAARLGWPEGTLSGRLARARSLLARRLVRRGVTITGATLAAAMSESAAPAAVPTPLLVSTLKAAMLAAAGRGLVAGAISAHVATLTEGVLKAMLLTKLKLTVAVLLAVSVLGGGAAWLAQPLLAGPQTPTEAREVNTVNGKEDAEQGGPEDTLLKEGWKKSIPISEPLLGEGDSYLVWIEKGWLQAKRQTKTGQTDWHIVLARVTDPKPPAIACAKGTITFDLSYHDGRYFIRETAGILRCLRERKRGPEGTWPRSHFLDAKYRTTGSAGSPDQQPMLSGWENGAWFVIASGPSNDRFDFLMRLNGMPESVGHGFQSFQGSLRKAYAGPTWILDDGESLTAERGLESFLKEKRVKVARREKLFGAPAPLLEGKKWYNSQQPLTWKDLQGKVVLLDFWATWCGPCVQKIPDTQALYGKLRGQGLVVIGIHSAQGADKVADFLKTHKLSFPVMEDTGHTCEAFAIEAFPSYLLIDKSGKVVRGISHDLPKEEEIKKLLDK